MHPSKTQRGFFKLARYVSLLSQERARHGSVIVNAGRFVAAACNKGTAVNWINGRGYWTLHAEIGACLGIDKTMLKGAVMYNWRETRTGLFADAAPCILCMGELRRLGIRKVFFTTVKEPYFGEYIL